MLVGRVAADVAVVALCDDADGGASLLVAALFAPRRARKAARYAGDHDDMGSTVTVDECEPLAAQRGRHQRLDRRRAITLTPRFKQIVARHTYSGDTLRHALKRRQQCDAHRARRLFSVCYERSAITVVARKTVADDRLQ